MRRIELRNVSGVYRSGEVGLQPTDLIIEPGELVGVLGPSGSGKSTLIRLIAGLDRPATGSIHFDDRLVNDISASGRDVGMVITQGALYDHMTAENNLRFPLQVAGVDEPEQTDRTEREADRYGIRRLLGRKPGGLSAGERQLVATGRATVRETPVLLFDEALAGVDPHLRGQVRNEIRRLHDGTHTIVYATNEQEEAMALADRLVILRNGVVQQAGAPLEVYRSPANVFVAEFLGSPGMNVVPAEPRREALRIGFDEIAGVTSPPAVDRLLVGIRPEDIHFAAPGDPFDQCLHARVTAVEELGDHRVAHVAFGEPDSGALDFQFRVPPGRPLAVGDRVELRVPVDKLTYFDGATELRL